MSLCNTPDATSDNLRLFNVGIVLNMGDYGKYHLRDCGSVLVGGHSKENNLHSGQEEFRARLTLDITANNRIKASALHEV